MTLRNPFQVSRSAADIDRLPESTVRRSVQLSQTLRETER